ncbi:Zinc-type alcohol dehydrogenase-like protein [Sphaceloma murrayae]|uniref:Zinc-type alcohol dehydrogenase-like protein n=1 Tax=Sphaceloma murrayae TaxID=2082308 RepID=A0A2K1QR80_9PEZI|nr:Zinc-type alcohol dehydrogenase-like protein [Sphaceloma murrayae]
MPDEVKAWTFSHEGYPKALKPSSLPVKDTLSPTELRVKVKAAAINPVDIQLMNLPLWPYLPSFLAAPTHGVAEDFSGVVEAAGEDSGFKPGDEIFGMVPILSTGTLQSTIVISASAAALAPKPRHWSHSQAAALPLVYLTARTVIAATQPYLSSTRTPRVAVLGGSSATGMYCVHLAKKRGWTVIASCSGRNADFVRSMGADEVIDYTTTNVPGSLGEWRPDAIMDCVGGTECIGLADRYVTIVGDKTSRSAMGGALTYLWNPRMVLRSYLGKFGLGKSYDCVNLELKREWLEETLSLEKGGVVDSEFGFGEVREAFERLGTGRARGKVVVRVE